MIVSYLSLGVAALTFVYGICRDVSQRKQNKKNSDKINSVIRTSLQSGKESFLGEQQNQINTSRPQRLTIGFNSTEKYLESFFEIFYLEYLAFRNNGISEEFWTRVKEENKQMIKRDLQVFQTGWKKYGYKYDDQDFVSFIDNEVFPRKENKV